MQPSLTRLYARILYATVFTTGAAVLILEILAVRMLSPFFGTSMFVLSSVLTVILGALSLGYYYGGRLADRFPHHVPLYAIIATGGFFLLVLYLLSRLVFPVAPEILSLTYGPLVLAVFFFFFPAFLLGIDSPFVIKLLSLRSPNEAGSVVGTTFFWSTLGSIAGSLSAGFILIPFVGISTTIICTSLVLTVGATLASKLLSAHAPGTNESMITATHITFIAIVTVIIALLATGLSNTTKDKANHLTLYQAEGYYAHIQIFEREFSLLRPPARFLQREVNSESAMFPDSYDHVFSYTRFAELYKTMLSPTASTSFLMFGGGAYTIPRILVAKDPNITIDVAELEPSLYPLAQKYFGLTDTSRITNHVMDARVFVAQTDKRYDTIFLDTFNSGHYIPVHLTTQEFFKEVRSKLTPGGLFIINYIGARDLSAPALTESLQKTVAQVFPNVRTFTFSLDTPTSRQNIMFVAQNSDQEMNLDHTDIIDSNGVSVPLASLLIPQREDQFVNQLLFTDDRAPVEYLIAKQLTEMQ